MTSSPPSAPWRRLDPRMLVVHPLREVARFVPALLVVLLAGRAARDGDGGAWQLLLVLGPLALGVLRYLSTRYLVTPERVVVRHGLVRRRVLEVPRARVRTVDLTATLSQRLLGLVSLRVGTGMAASSEQADLVLDGLGATAAAELRDDLLGAPGGTGGTRVHGTGGPGQEPAVVLRFRPSWLRFAPLDTTALAATLAALASGVSLVLQTAPGLGRTIDDTAGPRAREAVPLVGVALLALLAGAALLVLVVGPILRTVLVDGGYRLERTPWAWRVTRGLLTRQETTLDDARLAGVVVDQGLAVRAAGGAVLRGIATGGIGEEGGLPLLVPAAPVAEVAAVAARVVAADVVAAPLRDHGPAARARRWTRAGAPAALVCVALGAAGVVLAPTSAAVVAGLVVLGASTIVGAAFLAADRARHLGHALLPRHLVTSAGSWRRRREVLARDHVIGWQVRTSPWQRRRGLATVRVMTAGGTGAVTLLDLPDDDLVPLAEVVTPGLLSPFAAPPARSTLRPPAGGRVATP